MHFGDSKISSSSNFKYHSFVRSSVSPERSRQWFEHNWVQTNLLLAQIPMLPTYEFKLATGYVAVRYTRTSTVEKERKSVCVCVCVCVWEREREREREREKERDAMAPPWIATLGAEGANFSPLFFIILLSDVGIRKIQQHALCLMHEGSSGAKGSFLEEDLLVHIIASTNILIYVLSFNMYICFTFVGCCCACSSGSDSSTCGQRQY